MTILFKIEKIGKICYNSNRYLRLVISMQTYLFASATKKGGRNVCQGQRRVPGNPERKDRLCTR